MSHSDSHLKFLCLITSLVLFLTLPLAAGFDGDNCENNMDDCAGVDCGQGECIDGVEQAFCKCPVGFTGLSCSKTTSRDLDLQMMASAEVQSVYPFDVNCTELTLGAWVKYVNDRQGTFLEFYLTE